MDLSVYLSPTPRLELKEDYVAGLQGLSSIKAFFSGVLSGIDNLKEKLHIFNTVYREKNINEFREIKKLKGKVDKIISTKKYENVMNIKVAGLAGLNSLSIAAEELPKLLDRVNDNTLKGLEEVERILSEFISDLDFRKSYSFKYSSILGKLRDEHHDIDYTIGSFVNLSIIEDVVPIKNVIPNLQTLSLLYDKMYSAGEKTDTSMLNKINKKVFDISDKVDIIEEILNSQPDSFSKTAVNGLADLLSEYSKQLKTHSLIYFLTGEVLKIYINIVDVVEGSKV